MNWFVDVLRQHPEVALFLSLAIGYALGRIKLGSVQLGAVTGMLIAGVVSGQVGVTISPDLSSAFFLMFLFSIGYKTGPQFVNGLRASGLTQVGLTVLLCVTGLLAALGLSRLFGFDAGTAAIEAEPGIPAFAIGKLQIGLSLSVGVLIGGLLFGRLRSVDRRFGRIPEPALWLFDSVGLAAFMAATGLRAGPDFVRGLQQSGVSLVIAGLLGTSIPFLLTILVGRYLLKMHPGVLLGVCAGAGTSAPGLAAVQEVAKSKIPTLGYGVKYAVGNVLLALWGSVMVVLMA